MAVAQGIFAKDKGIVLQFNEPKQLVFGINCVKFSNFSNEQEILFIGGYSQIRFETIIIIKGNTGTISWTFTDIFMWLEASIKWSYLLVYVLSF